MQLDSTMCRWSIGKQALLCGVPHPRTSCRPRRITISNLSFSAPPFSTTKSLAPLSKVTHLHLIKIVPPPALISFLVGEQINLEEQGNVPNSIKAGLSPRETLSACAYRCCHLMLLSILQHTLLGEGVEGVRKAAFSASSTRAGTKSASRPSKKVRRSGSAIRPSDALVKSAQTPTTIA